MMQYDIEPIYRPIGKKEVGEIMRKIYARDIDEQDYEKLSAVIIHLDAVNKEYRTDKLLVAAGAEKLVEELDMYINKVYYRNAQLKKVNILTNKIIAYAFRLGKKIPKKNKIKRNCFLKYIKKIKNNKRHIMYCMPKETGGCI